MNDTSRIKLALIVDDSRTAQLRLRRMLESYDLQIDIVSSAEEALSYLSYRAPAVIFLDQSMKGMDGIDALKTIKANPTTATIPVIMYTSEKGHVFTGQARALGALDILHKSTLKPASLEKVLSALKLKPNHVEPSSTDNAESNAANLTLNPAANSVLNSTTPITSSYSGEAAQTPNRLNRESASDLEEVHAQIARLFEIHIADVGRKITDSTLLISKRFAVLQKKVNDSRAEVVVNDIPLSIINDEISAERKKISLVSNSLLATLLIGLFIIGILLIGIRSDLKNSSLNYQSASEISEMNAIKIDQLATHAFTETINASSNNFQNSATDSGLLNTISWAATTDFSFEHAQEPLNEALLSKFQQLLYMLSDSGFRGSIDLIINFGDVCLQQQETGEYILAPDSTPIADCVFRNSLKETFDSNDFMSLAFTNFVQATVPLQNGSISLTVNTNGLSSPRVVIPNTSETKIAKDWNNQALKNNYIAFYFEPEEDQLSLNRF